MVLPAQNPPPMMGPPPGPPMADPMMGPPPGDPMMMGGPPMMPPSIPGFPPGVMPDMNYPGSPAVRNAEMMMAMQDPMVALALIRLFLEDVDKDPGPKYPGWYRKDDYQKPTMADIRMWSEQDREDYRMLIERMRRDRDVIRAAVVGTFSDYDPENEETWRDTSLALDFQLITSILAACHFLIYKNARKSGQADEAQQIENYGYAIIDHWKRRHRKLNGTMWQPDMIKTAMSTGHLVTRVIPNFNADEGEIPLFIDTLDPASCFFQFDAYGLRSMTRIYHQPVMEVCHGFRLGKDAKKKLMAKPEKGKNGQSRNRKETDPVEVIEYWDRRYYGLVVDHEDVVQPIDHQLGRVPVALTRSAVGDAGNIYEQNLFAGWGIAATSRQRDLANKGQSHVQFLQIGHAQREAVMGIVATEIQKIKNPPRTFKQDIMAYGDAPDINNSAGGVSMLKAEHEEEVPNTPDSRVSLLGPIMSNVTEAAQRGMLSAVDHGAMPGAQSSGTVVEGLSEASKDKFNLWKMMCQEHIEEVIELGLIFTRDHGRKMGQDGKRGTTFPVDLQRPDADGNGSFDFDYKILHNHSTDVKVEMTSIRMQNLGPMANAVQMWSQQGLMTKVEALELRAVRDPQSYLRQVQIEQFKSTPEYMTAKLLEWMKEEGESPETMATVMYLLSTQRGGQGGGQGAPAPVGAMPGQGGSPPPTGMPGGPGQQGGRPPQLPGPVPSMGGIIG